MWVISSLGPAADLQVAAHAVICDGVSTRGFSFQPAEVQAYGKDSACGFFVFEINAYVLFLSQETITMEMEPYDCSLGNMHDVFSLFLLVIAICGEFM